MISLASYTKESHPGIPFAAINSPECQEEKTDFPILIGIYIIGIYVFLSPVKSHGRFSLVAILKAGKP